MIEHGPKTDDGWPTSVTLMQGLKDWCGSLIKVNATLIARFELARVAFEKLQAEAQGVEVEAVKVMEVEEVAA